MRIVVAPSGGDCESLSEAVHRATPGAIILVLCTTTTIFFLLIIGIFR